MRKMDSKIFLLEIWLCSSPKCVSMKHWGRQIWISGLALPLTYAVRPDRSVDKAFLPSVGCVTLGWLSSHHRLFHFASPSKSSFVLPSCRLWLISLKWLWIVFCTWSSNRSSLWRSKKGLMESSTASGLWNQFIWSQILAKPLTSCVTLGKLLNLSVPGLPHL